MVHQHDTRGWKWSLQSGSTGWNVGDDQVALQNPINRSTSLSSASWCNRRVVQMPLQRTRMAATTKPGRVKRLAPNKASNTCDVRCTLTGPNTFEGRDEIARARKVVPAACSFTVWHAHHMPSVTQSARRSCTPTLLNTPRSDEACCDPILWV